MESDDQHHYRAGLDGLACRRLDRRFGRLALGIATTGRWACPIDKNNLFDDNLADLLYLARLNSALRLTQDFQSKGAAKLLDEP